MSFNYLSKSTIKTICAQNSMCRDTYEEFKKKNPYMDEYIIDMYSVGFNFPRGHIKYVVNGKVYDFMYQD